ncbi:C-factor-like [Plakobranchus ocellatus]|uniref:C-factor-like n=1 Tax=Plakobranchus ocellatus TaxID=259542 RepID=A0AAV4AJD4_9GAST|nr:C-factor-like [Plakobranchus ocellatus]
MVDTPKTAKTLISVGDDDQENAGLPSLKKPCLSPDLFEDTPKKGEKRDLRAADTERCEAAKRLKLPNTEADGVKETAAAEKLCRPQQESEDDGPHIPPAMLSIMQKKLTGRSNSHSHVFANHSGSVITRGFDGFGGSTTFVHPQGPPRGSLLRLGQQRKPSSSGLKKNANIQRLAVSKSQRQIKDCINVKASAAASGLKEVTPSTGSLSSTSSSSSSSSSLSSLSSSSAKKSSLLSSTCKKKNSSLLPSSTLGMFVSKGQSLLAKKPTVQQNDVIDLTSNIDS